MGILMRKGGIGDVLPLDRRLLMGDPILAWHRTLVAKKCDGSQQRQSPGRPTIKQALEALMVCIAREHRSWGSDRIVGALANLGLTVSDQTVGNVRSCTWPLRVNISDSSVDR